MAATTRQDKIRRGSIVRYHGSKEHYHGILFKVLAVWGGRLVLDYYDDPTGDIVIWRVRPSSVTRIAAKDILDRKCRKCGFRYRVIRGESGNCPFPELH